MTTRRFYSRLAASDVFATPMRRAVLDHFARAPGATAAEAARALGVDYKTVLHHARVLKAFGLLASRRAGRRILYYAPVVAAPDAARSAKGH